MTRIGTWNLENLFRPGAAGPTDQQAHQAKLTALAAKVTAMNPDVLAAREVGDPDALADLAAAVGGPWHRRTAAPDGRKIRVGVLSRLPLSEVTQVSDFPGQMRTVQIDDTSAGISVGKWPGAQPVSSCGLRRCRQDKRGRPPLLGLRPTVAHR